MKYTKLALLSALVLGFSACGDQPEVVAPIKPVTLDAVSFTSPTTIQIGGPGATLNSTITNNTAVALTDIAIQAWVQQGTARRAASGREVSCNVALGVLPPGTCITIGDGVIADNFVAGTGTLVPGSATAVIQVVQLLVGGGNTVIDSLSVPITLIGPPIGETGRPWLRRASPSLSMTWQRPS